MTETHTSLITSVVGWETVDVQHDAGLVLRGKDGIKLCPILVGRTNTHSSVHARDGNQRAWSTTATADDIDLSTTNIELGTPECRRGVKGDLQRE